MRHRAALLAVLVPIAARAADQPRATSPQRDVDVIYQVYMQESDKKAVLSRMRHSQALNRDRWDQNLSNWTLYDYTRHQFSLVSDADKTSFTRHLDDDPSRVQLRPGQSWQDTGHRVIAGLACTDWLLTGPDGPGAMRPGDKTCLTDDGVELRTEHNGNVLELAVSVTYAPQPASLFVVPSGYINNDLIGTDH